MKTKEQTRKEYVLVAKFILQLIILFVVSMGAVALFGK